MEQLIFIILLIATIEDTPANDDVQLQVPIRSDKFTHVGFPGWRSRKTTWTRPTFHAQNVPAASFGCLPPPMPERYLGPATYPTSSPETVSAAPFGCLPPPLPERYLGPATYLTTSPETLTAAPFGCLPPPLPEQYLGPAMYPTSSLETVPSAPFGCLPPPLSEWYFGPATYLTTSPETVPAAPFGCLPGPAMYVWWQPQPPSPATVAAADFRFPPPPKPEFYVGPAWFDVNGPPATAVLRSHFYVHLSAPTNTSMSKPIVTSLQNCDKSFIYLISCGNTPRFTDNRGCLTVA